jgi:hypothetical protein
VLWDVSVDGRLARRGHASPDARAGRWREFRAAFAELADSGATVFARLWDADRVTHAELLALATGARRPECPLCRLSSSDLDGASSLTRAAVQAICADFPSWTREAGMCRRCAELYGARVTQERRLPSISAEKWGVRPMDTDPRTAIMGPRGGLTHGPHEPPWRRGARS